MADWYDDSVSWMTIVSIRTPLAGRSETWPLDAAAGTKVQVTSDGHSVAVAVATPVNWPFAGRTLPSAPMDTRCPSGVVRAAPVRMVV